MPAPSFPEPLSFLIDTTPCSCINNKTTPQILEKSLTLEIREKSYEILDLAMI
jgi:hypothetical protein